LRWLAQQPGFRDVADRADRLLALQRDLQACASALELQALGVDGETLLVGARGAAAAAKLRQMEPSILACLRARGWPLARIRFRPRSAGTTAAPPPPRARPPIPDEALAGLRDLAQKAATPALRDAIDGLLRTQARQRRAR
jgi:hypothetical protein